jgi:hypothetical protein
MAKVFHIKRAALPVVPDAPLGVQVVGQADIDRRFSASSIAWYEP